MLFVPYTLCNVLYLQKCTLVCFKCLDLQCQLGQWIQQLSIDVI